MKKNHYYRSMSAILPALFIFFISCVPDDEFDIPDSAILKDIKMETTTDLDAILGSFFQSKHDLITIDQDLLIEAYVVSSDESGNFYKQLVLQDKPVNPTAGITVQINMPAYFQSFDFGRKVYLKLKGLSIAEKNGVVVLGLANGKQIDQIPKSRISQYIIRTAEVAEIVPLQIKVVDFTDRRENLFVQINNMQFSKFHIGQGKTFTFASEDNDEYDGERLMESCAGDFSFILSTSTYADFKTFRLPENSGSVKGILTRDYYDKFFTIYLNSPGDLNFSDSPRCDAPAFDCGLAQAEGKKVLFSEEFTGTNNKPVTGKGWTNFVQEGSRSWEVFTASGANATLGKSARVRPTGSGDYKTISWLITPLLELSIHRDEVLTFKTSTSFANNSILDVLISTNWNGEEAAIETANWKILSAAYVAQSSDYFGDWLASGLVDLSCVEGDAHIAFRYTGSDVTYYNGIYELDDIRITAE